MMEFLPHTLGKSYTNNIKSGRFLQAVSAFKGKRGDFELGQSLRVMLIGAGNLIGEDDAVKNSVTVGRRVETLYTTTVSCFSQ
jgi:hypothetical protein